MKSSDVTYLFKHTWFLILFSGFLGYIVIHRGYYRFDYEPSQIILSTVLPASIMYTGLIVGYNTAKQKKK